MQGGWAGARSGPSKSRRTTPSGSTRAVRRGSRERGVRRGARALQPLQWPGLGQRRLPMGVRGLGVVVAEALWLV